MQSIRRALTGLALIFIISAFSFAQTGTIEGVVTDRTTGETIIGANILIEGTLTGTSTDLDGRYVLRAPMGTHTIKIMFISYESVVTPGVVVEAGKATRLDVTLAEVSTEIRGVQVTARRITNTETSMISSIKASSVVITGITAQQILRSQDSDAAAVVKRVPGVTIVDDRFIMIRGLSERYNPAMLHNTFAPSMEADIKSFSFDVIPSSLIDRILIYKSPSPELPGDFAGGVVKVFTRSIPDNNFISLSYSSGYDSNSSLRSFQRQEVGSRHWTGLNDGYNALPDGFPTNLRSIASDQTRVQEAGRSLRNNWTPRELNAGLNHSLSLSGAYKFGVGAADIGNITSLTYNRSRSVDDILRRDYNQYDDETGVSSVIYNFNDSKNSEKIRIGLLHNWSVNLGSRNKIELINLFNQLSQSDYTFRTGPMYEFNYFANNHSFYQIFRGIYSGQLAGKHEFFGERMTIDWTAGTGRSYRMEPDYRRYRTDYDTETEEISTYIPTGAAATYFLGRFYSEMREKTNTASFNITHRVGPGSAEEKGVEVSAGGFYESKGREFYGRNLGYVRANSATFDQSLIYSPIGDLFSDANINPDTGIKIDEQTNPSDSYQSANTLTAFYIMSKIPVAGRVNISAGVRFENNNMSLDSRTLTNEPVQVDDQLFKALPSINVAYSFSEKSLARVALGRTLNRPEFRELAPFGFYDFNYNLVRKGNPELVSAIINNLDLRFEHYPAPGEQLTIGVFYKSFNNPIELTFLPGGGTAGIKTFIPVNAAGAVSMGAEAEVRKSLGGLTSNRVLSRMTLLFNGALIYSRIRAEETGGILAFDERPMQGQSPFIINTGLYYNDTDRKLQLNAAYNIIGRRINWLQGVSRYL
jgi:TonB-dependent receptor